MSSVKPLISERFPRSAKYYPEWVLASVSGAASSIFLRREFGVQVWTTDLWFSASENLQRIRDADVEAGVFPIHADARSLLWGE